MTLLPSSQVPTRGEGQFFLTPFNFDEIDFNEINFDEIKGRCKLHFESDSGWIYLATSGNGGL